YAINQEVTTFRGTAIDLSSTAVLSAIQGDYAVNGQETGLAVGLFSSNTGQPSSFQAAFNDVEITATGDTAASGEVEIATLEDTIATDRAMVLYRVNAGGVQIAALDNNIPWSADTIADNNFYLSNSGSNTVAAFPNVLPGGSLTDIPQEIFASERWDLPEDPAMAWAFDIPQAGLYEVRLYIGNGFAAADEVGERIFDVAVEGNVPIEFAEIDPVGQFGHEIGGVISTTTEVRDGTLNLEFIHGRENPLVNGIEIWQIAHDNPPISVSLAEAELTTEEDRGQVQISLLADSVVPSNETLYATLEILPDSAIAKLDYEYQSDTASFDESTGIYTDRLAIAGSSFDATLTVDLIADNMIEEPEMFTVRLVDLSSQGLVGESSSQVTIEDSSFIGDIILERSGSADIPAAREFM
ncbi:MAG: malectin domain-containing carbohydrate-binding protein, partial [Cyanobacteria bacterium J06633_1]